MTEYKNVYVNKNLTWSEIEVEKAVRKFKKKTMNWCSKMGAWNMEKPMVESNFTVKFALAKSVE